MGSGRPPLIHTSNFSALSLLHYPQIRNLSLNIPQSQDDIGLQGLTDLRTDLESLELAYTHLDPHRLANVLKACPNLRELKYDFWSVPARCDPGFDEASKWTPDTSSERLLSLSVLRQTLSIVEKTLETFHFHVAPPCDQFNQCLQRMSFSGFPRLTTLHVPFQLLLGQDRGSRLRDSVPSTLQHLWLNDDGLVLWMRDDYYSRDDSSVRLVHADSEMIAIIEEFLADCNEVTPSLRTIALLLSSRDYRNRGYRDKELISASLMPHAAKAGVALSVRMMRDRSVFAPEDDYMGQGPPYFDLEVVGACQINDLCELYDPRDSPADIESRIVITEDLEKIDLAKMSE